MDHFEDFVIKDKKKKVPIFKFFEFTLLLVIISYQLSDIYRIDFSQDVLLVAGTVLAFFYLLFGFAIFNDLEFFDMVKKESYKRLGFWEILRAILLGIGFSGFVFGILFIFLNLDGAFEFLVLSACHFFILLLISGMVHIFRYKKYKIGRVFLVRSVGAILINILILFIVFDMGERL